jgi:hypothetical protein
MTFALNDDEAIYAAIMHGGRWRGDSNHDRVDDQRQAEQAAAHEAAVEAKRRRDLAAMQRVLDDVRGAERDAQPQTAAPAAVDPIAAARGRRSDLKRALSDALQADAQQPDTQPSTTPTTRATRGQLAQQIRTELENGTDKNA